MGYYDWQLGGGILISSYPETDRGTYCGIWPKKMTVGNAIQGYQMPTCSDLTIRFVRFRCWNTFNQLETTVF
jgi:hypothetical protein